MSDAVKKRSVTVAGHRTSVSIEAPFWDALRDIAARRNASLDELIASIDSTNNQEGRAGNLSSAIRVFVLRELQRN